MEEGESFSKKKKKKEEIKKILVCHFSIKKKVNLDVNEFILPKEVLLMWF